MPEKIEKDGVEIDMFTAEEVAERETAAAAAIKVELDNTNAKLATVNLELEKLNSKDHNFSSLRAQKDELEKKLDDMNNGINVKIEEIKKAPLLKYESDVLINLSSGDEELKKKIKFHYDRLSDKADNEESVSKKMNDAYLLAVGSHPRVDAIGMAIPAGGSGAHSPVVRNSQLSQDLKELGKKFGLTDEDMK